MKRGLCAILVVLATTAPSRAYIDSTLTLGKLISVSNQIAVLQVDKVSREKRVIIFKKVADLKGQDTPEVVNHKLTDGTHPRQARTILDWAEPGAVAIWFRAGNVSQTCLGSFWYECAIGEAPWWTMTQGKPELCFSYSGSPGKLRDHVAAILQGREVVVTALKYAAFDPGEGARKTSPQGWATYEAVGSGRLMRGKDWPIWRLKASLKTPAITMHLVQDSLKGRSQFIVGDGAGGPEDVPALVKALQHEDGRIRAEAANDLGLIGPQAAEAVPALLKLSANDPEALTQLAAAKAVALLDPRNEAVFGRLIGALKEKHGRVRRRAAEDLGDLGPGAKAAVPELVKAVKDADPGVRWASLDALGQIGPEAEAAVPALIEALDDGDTRGAAVDALGLIGPKAQKAVPALGKLLRGDEADRWPAAAALVRIGGPGSKAGVRYFLKTADPKGGKALYDAENILVAPAAQDARREMIDAVREPTLRDTAVQVLRDKNFVPLTTTQLADVEKFLGDPNPGVRCVAAWVVHCGRRIAGESVDYKEVIAVQRDALKSADPWARRQAAHFLGSFGPNARDASDDLAALPDDKDEEIRKATAKALKNIRGK
jgi:HEAT repeat protein